jgi:uncharacterized protein YjiS (DUF1127 family)
MVTFNFLHGRHASRELARDATATAPLVARLGATLARAYRVRRDTRQLMALSDHMLSDIGVARADVEHAVRFGRDRR